MMARRCQLRHYATTKKGVLRHYKKRIITGVSGVGKKEL